MKFKRSLIIFVILLISEFVSSQTYRVRKNEIGCFYFTNTDFDNFPIFKKTTRSKIPINYGRGFHFGRLLYHTLYVEYDHFFWVAFPSEPLLFGDNYFKWAHFNSLSLRNNFIDKKYFKISGSIQLILRKGGVYTKEKVYDLSSSHKYFDWGIKVDGMARIKIIRCLSFDLRSGYIYYFYIKDHSLNRRTLKPLITNKSVMISFGLSFLF